MDIDLPEGGEALAPLPDWLERLIEGKGCTDWVRINWHRAAAVENAWFDEAKANGVVAMWPDIFKLTTLRFKGKRFRLAWWQEIIVRMLVGWKRPIDIQDPDSGKMVTEWVRLYRELRLWVPRKSGKSEFLAALYWLFWGLDGQPGGEGYIFAADEAQGNIPFTKVSEMGKLMPADISGGYQFFKGIIWCPSLAARTELLTGSAGGKHGKAPYCYFGDEIHQWKNRQVEDDLRQGSGVHLQPMGLLASTAGVRLPNKADIGMRYFDETRAMLDGTAPVDTTLAVIFAADADDDWESEEVWAKCNPNLHLTVTLDYLRIEHAKAKLNARAEAHFRCYHLNQWVDDSVAWLNLKAWDACTDDKTSWQRFENELRGRPCFAGIDLSRSRDFSAWALIFPPQEAGEKWKLLVRLWLPEAALAQREKAPREQIEKYIAAGAINLVPGEVIDQDDIRAQIIADIETFDMQQIALDRMFAAKLMTDLQKDGVDPELMKVMGQGMLSMAAPSVEFERMVYAAELDHGGHPALRWMARHCAIRFDAAMNFMPAKGKSRESIDGIMAAVMALAASMAEQEEQPEASMTTL